MNPDARIEELLEKPCWVIDGLPERVPENSAGQYASLEEVFHTPELFEKFTAMTNPSPAVLSAWIRDVFETQGRILILTAPKEALITLNGDDNYMTVYGPDAVLLERTSRIAGAEGLFVWKGAE